MSIKAAIEDFARRLQTIIEGQALERARAAVFEAIGASPYRGSGRPPKAIAALAPVVGKARRKAPLQLCPVPGCKNAAAPIFGMVCAKHKDVAKSKIRKYREARKAKQLKAAS